MTTHVPLNIVVYSRISLAEKDPLTGELDISKVEAQEQAASAWVERQGHRVAAIVRENSQSAYREWTRKKFNEVLRQAQAGEVDGVVSYAQDRLVRHPEEMEALIRLAERQGRLIRCLDGLFDLTTDSGRQAARLLVVFARGEVERKSKRHRDGNARRLSDGRPPQGGGRPFGFEADKVTVRACEADLIRQATARYLGGAHLRTLVREWNEAEILTTRGGKWTRNTITLLLKRWRNAGLREHTPEAVDGREGETVLTEAVWPAIVTRDQVEAVRRLLALRAAGPVLVARKHLLSGIVICSKCGSTMQASGTTQNGKFYPTYRCQGGRTAKRCSSSVRQDVADEVVLDQAARLLALPSAALVNVEGTRRATMLRTERGQIMEQTKALTSAELSREFAAILAKVAGFNDRVKVIDAELERLSENDALAALVADLSPLSAHHVSSYRLPAGNRAAVRTRLDDLRVSDLGKLRRVLRSLVQVELLPWEGVGKPNAETARRRVRVSEADRFDEATA